MLIACKVKIFFGYFLINIKKLQAINQYITYVRVNNAEKLLENSKYSITQIADMCGFCGSTYFSSVFKKFKGMAPLTFRKERLSNLSDNTEI